MIDNYEFWGVSVVAEYDTDYSLGHWWKTDFYFDSGTYIKSDVSSAALKENPNGKIIEVGYISEYNYFGGKKCYEKNGTKVE